MSNTLEEALAILAKRADQQLETELRSPSAGRYLYGFRLVENPTVGANEIQFRDKDNRILGCIINIDIP